MKKDDDLKVLTVILLIFFLASFVRCQHIKQHTNQEEYEDSIGVKFLEVTSKDESLIFWKQELRYQVKVSSFGYDSKTIFPDKFKPEGCFVAIYCKTHMYLYLLVQNHC